jgi:proline dehydrogenase
MKNMVGRLHMLADAASQKGVNLLLDAEQTYMQPAIDHLVLNLQRKYNR